MRLMPCTEECFLPSHNSLEQGGYRLLGHQPLQILVLRAAVESVGQLFPQGRERGGLTEGKIPVRNTEQVLTMLGKYQKGWGYPLVSLHWLALNSTDQYSQTVQSST